MIARLRGKVVEKQIDRIILDVGGVGYDVQVSLNTYNALPDGEEEVTLYIHTHIREDAFNLMGFLRKEEREIFRLLIQVSGIGPRMGLNILSGIEPDELIETLKHSNLARLTSIPGIGKRLAERIIVDLRDKVKDLELGLAGDKRKKTSQVNELRANLRSALVNMGYKQTVVDKLLPLLKEDLEAERDLGTLLRVALQKLSKGR